MLLTAAIIFFIIAIVAYVLGAQGVAGMSVTAGKWLLIIFLILAVLSFLFGSGMFDGGPIIDVD